jgi:hypothetical protein
MEKKHNRKAGCGCLIFVLIFCMIITAASIHPFSLRLMAGRLSYIDKVLGADIILVPRFSDDKNGELYTEAFREFWAGNGKLIFVEEDRVFGFSMKDIVSRMAKERGFKEDVVRPVSFSGNDRQKAARIREFAAKQGFKKVLIIVPSYCSRRYHFLYEPKETVDVKNPVFLVKSTDVSYFSRNGWWKNGLSRSIGIKELYRLGGVYLARLPYVNKIFGNEK